jgi:hypothetical protein
MYAHEMYAHKTHAYEMHTHQTHAHEMQAYKMQAGGIFCLQQNDHQLGGAPHPPRPGKWRGWHSRPAEIPSHIRYSSR